MTKESPVPELGFADRLAYLRWLRARGRVSIENDRALADWLGVGEGWLAKWKVRSDAPEGRTQLLAIEGAIAQMGATIQWLYDGVGRAPAPALWKEWYEAWYLLQIGRPMPSGNPETMEEVSARTGIPLAKPKPTFPANAVEKPASRASGQRRRKQ